MRRILFVLGPLMLALAAPALHSGCGTKSAPVVPDSTRTLRQRLTALEAARSFGGTALFDATRHPDARVRRTAVRALGRIQDASALAVLLPRLEDPDSIVVEQTAWALRQLQGLDQTARGTLELALVHAMETAPPSRLWMFVEAVRPVAGAQSFLEVSKWVAAGMFASMGSQAREPRLEGMAALTLASTDTERAGTLLSQMGDLTNRDGEAAWRIAEAMTVRNDSTYLPSVLSLARHRDAVARAAGARALAKYPDARSAAALYPLLADLEWEVRAHAVRALGDLGFPQSRSYCAAMTADSHPLVREAALAALEKLGARDSEHLVADALRDSVPAVRLAALRVLSQSPSAAARSAFDNARQDPVDFVRAEALDVAPRVLGAEKAAELCMQVLVQGSVRERSQAAQALGAFGGELPPTSRRALRSALELALADTDFVVATQAAEALGKLAQPEAVPALLAAYDRWQTRHHDADVRLTIVPALGGLAGKRPDPEIVLGLERATQDPDPRVAFAAEQQLASLRGQPEPPERAPQARADAVLPDTLPAIDLGLVRVRLVTRHGQTILELDGDNFPRTVANFLHLIDSGFYRDGVFHRVVPAFVVQGGCPRGDGWGDAGAFLPCEYGNLRFDRAGIIGMAHAGKDTGGSQFFITHLPVPRLDGRYTAFGRVVDGMEHIDRITRGDRFRCERDLPAATP